LTTDCSRPGPCLQPLRKGLTQTALVLPDGNLKVGEQVFTAVSPAAMAVSGNKAEAGWEFWGAPSGEGGYVPLFTLRERLREDGPKAAPAPAPRVLAEPPPAEPRSPESASPATAEPVAPASQGSAASPPAAGDTTPARKKPRQFTETVKDLLGAGLLHPGEELRSVRKALSDVRAKLGPDGRLEIDGEVHGSLSAAAVAVSGTKAEAGWEFWAVERDGKLVRLYDLRDEFRAARAGESHETAR